MSTVSRFQVTGMSCAHCENAIRQEVGALAGVESVEVSATDGALAVTSAAPLPAAEILAAVDEAGYTATPVAS